MNSKSFIIILSLLVALVIISSCANNKSVDKGSDIIKKNVTYPVYRQNRPIEGFDSAPVEMTYYFDYQCQWCKDFETNTLPELKKYVDNGTLSITYKHYVFIGKDSLKAALAGECVFRDYELDKFLEYHTLMYKNQKTKNTGWVTDELLQNISETISVDYSYLSGCINNKTYILEIGKDTNEGRFNGITSTPSFIINDKRLSGSLPVREFEKIIQSELMK